MTEKKRQPFNLLGTLLGSKSTDDIFDSGNMLEDMPVAVLAIDSSKKITYANRRARKTLGYESAELVGGSIYNVLPKLSEGPRQPLEQGTLTAKTEEFATRKDGTTFPARVHFRTVEGGAQATMIIAMEDLTREQELDKLKREFLAMVNHDLRTPITAVCGHLQLLEEGGCGEMSAAAKEKLATAQKILQGLTVLIHDLVLVEKLSSGTFSLDLQPVAMDEILERVLPIVATEADARDITLIFQTKQVTNLKVLADPARISQVLVNLVSNAIKFSPDASDIIVRCSALSNSMKVSVIDKGRGIPGASIEGLFDPFRQVLPNADSKAGGFGLGLAICKKIVEQHDGQIGVESTEGAGSEFWFTLPLAAA